MRAGSHSRIALTAVAASGLLALALIAAVARPAHAQIELPPLGGEVDTLPPTVEITEAPKSDLRTHKRRKPVTFAFTSDDPLASFTCRLDGSAYVPCTSPMSMYLTAGRGKGKRHTFFVRSADLAGNSSGVAVRSMRVQRLKPYR